ncbi:MAG: hypothetical protein JWO67_5494 [Streptosporangiaceae bacterium]|jgi:hypothetical protein|nr:hypothetical protein [Streptosporangiaceae bacterium]
MRTAGEGPPGPSPGTGAAFLAGLPDRAVWKLLVRGAAAVLPGCEVSAGSVRFAGRSSMAGVPVFLSARSGFVLSLGRRAVPAAPRREIYVRGRDVRSVGIVIAGEPTAVGTRIVDAAGLLRYARRLTFDSLFAAADEGSVGPAVRAARAVENVVLFDPDRGVGLCVEVDPVSRSATCPLFVRFGGRTPGVVRAYASGRAAAQAVRSQT